MEDSGSVSTPASGDSAATQASDTSAATESGAAPQSTQASPASEDPEFDVGGEKLTLSELKRLRDVEAKRKDYDRAASLRMEEAAKLRKQADADRAAAQELVAGLSKDTKAALRARGIDPVKFAEQTLAEALEEHQLTPEQKELRDLKAREKQRQEEDEAKQASEATAAEHQAVEQYTNEISGAFIAALKPLNLPAEDLPEAVARMAQRFESLMDSGAPVDIAAIAEDVADRLYAAPTHRFQSLSDEQLLARYPDIAERFRKALLNQASKPKTTTSRTMSSAPPKAKKPLTRAEFEARVAQRIGA